jgi:chemotaxis family two-component system sensor kinase Cph1
MLNLEAMVRETRAAITCDPLPEVVANSGLLTHVFQNLLENGMKFRGEQAPRIHVSAEPQADVWRLCVSDSGIGIDPRHLKQIFRIFKRLHGDHYEGTGIGLAVCKKIVECQGGRIWVESEQGHGAKFYFTLPAAESAVGQAAGE